MQLQLCGHGHRDMPQMYSPIDIFLTLPIDFRLCVEVTLQIVKQMPLESANRCSLQFKVSQCHGNKFVTLRNQIKSSQGSHVTPISLFGE